MSLRLCQAQSCAGRSRTEATKAVREGTGAAGELWQEGPLQGDSCPSWLCWRGLWQQVMGLFSLAEAMGVPSAMSSQRISHEKRCLRCQSHGCGRGAWSQLIPSSNTLSYRLCCLQGLRGPGFGELHGFRAPESMSFSRDWHWCKKQFHCFWFKEMSQNCLDDL